MMMERTYKIRVWEKETGKFAWSEIFTTSKNEKDMYEMVEGQMVNTKRYGYAIDEY